MAVGLPEGFVLDSEPQDTPQGLPEGFVLDGAQTAAQPTSRDTRIDNVGTAIDEFQSGKTGPTQAGFRVLGQGLGVINDKISEAIPQTVKDAASYGIRNLVDSNPIMRASNMALGQVAPVVGDAYNDFAKNNPGRALDLAAAGNIGGVVSLGIPGPRAISAASSAAPVVGKAVAVIPRAIGRAALPSIDSGLQEVAGLAGKYKIPLSLDQVSSSRALKNVQKVSQELPLSGQAGFRDRQMSAFNKAIFKTVGVDADKFTPQNMDLAFSKVGGEFDDLTKGKSFNIGGDFLDNATKTLDEVESLYGKEAADIYQKEALRVINDFGAGDAISGELIARQRARINGLARKAAPGQKEALLELENNIVDGITSGDPAIQQALSQAKQRYKNLIVIEPIANKAKGGNISPSLLNNRVSAVYKRAHTRGQSGEIGELARIGNELLPQLGGSDTTQKLLTASAVGAAVANPASIALTGAAMGANRLFQAGMNRNQSLVNAAVKKGVTKQDLQKAFEAKKGTK